MEREKAGNNCFNLTSSNVSVGIVAGAVAKFYDGANWKIKIVAPSNGILDDYALMLSAEVPPVLTLNTQDRFYYAPFGSQKKISLMIDKVMAESNGYIHEERISI